MKKALFSLLLTIACLPMALGQMPANVTVEDTTVTACGSYTWIDGNVYTRDTIVTHVQNDTVHVLDLTVTAPSIDTATAMPLSGGCSVDWNGKTWNTSGIFIDTIRATVAGQCDSVIKIEITLAGTDRIEEVVETACDYYVTSWGDTITSSINQTEVSVSTDGCGLTIGLLDITINHHDTAATEVLASVEGCSMMWNGIEVDVVDSVYCYTMEGLDGCDSVISVKVSAFSGSTYDTTYVDACDFYVDGDDTITANAFLTDVDTTGDCHAYHITAVTIHSSYTDTASVAVVDTVGGCNFVWFGRTYGAEAIDTVLYGTTRTVVAGCDSLVAVHLEGLSFRNHDTSFVEHCGRYYWSHSGRRDTLIVDGEYIDSTVANGCTTVNHLMLTFHDNYDTIRLDSVCASYTYVFDSRDGIAGRSDRAVLSTTGIHTTDENGVELYSTHFATRCVTHHAVEVKIKEPEQRQSGFDVDTVVCDEFRFTFNNVNYVWTASADSTLVDSRRTMRSCYDTYGHVKVTVNRKSYVNFNVDTCDFYIWRGYNDQTYTQSTNTEITLPDTLNADGCSVIGRLNLTINYTPLVTIEGDWQLERDSTHTTTLTAVSDEPMRSYKWYRNGTLLSLPDDCNVLVVEDIYDNVDIHLESTSANGCVAKNWLTITYNVGIDENEAVQVNLYPNPATRYLNIESAEALKDVVIYNAIGQQVIMQSLEGTRTTLDLGSLASGNYTMRLTAANGEQVTRKFIVSK